MSAGGLDTMKIVGYRDARYSDKIGSYTALVNPESYTISHDVNVNVKGAQGRYVPTLSYNSGTPQTIGFKILFDGTGVIKKGGGILPGLAVLGSNTSNVVDDILQFKKLVYTYDSTTHQPPFVQIQWGLLQFNCRLTRLTFNYKLFRPDGTPLRAEADCSFLGFIDERTLDLIQNPQSPDLTHTRTVKAGDTLPLLCYCEYGDSKYYNQVARFNGIIDMKRLTPGMKLSFPPITNNPV